LYDKLFIGLDLNGTFVMHSRSIVAALHMHIVTRNSLSR